MIPLAVCCGLCSLLAAQIAPSRMELDTYQGLFAAVARGDITEIKSRVNDKSVLEHRDQHGRTPLLVAAHLSNAAVARALLDAGANPRALDAQRYDLITIAAVKNNIDMIRLGLQYGADPAAVTSPYDGTALIAAAHLGHVETVAMLIAAGAPLDHVNNLGWTALIEAIVLGDGGPRYVEIVALLLNAGADVGLGDRNGTLPVTLAEVRGYDGIVKQLQQAGSQ